MAHKLAQIRVYPYEATEIAVEAKRQKSTAADIVARAWAAYKKKK